ncbi:hypothetical protein L596_004767 [Steinernema carpocapsae]|uniref:Uncharacterized protein n=1 Tax=Steinernema carpocapsae TaxID=34508 RepID=A0A4U8UXW7_STECR|nr:hypothetical protein L596_004767 [Steinernema carpocapsae]
MASSLSAVLILLCIAVQLATAYRPSYSNGYQNYNYYNYPRYNNGYGNYNYYNNYNPYRTYNNNGYGNYNYYNSYYQGYNNGYNAYPSYNYNYNPLSAGGTTAGGTYVGSPLARIWLTCNGIGCPARG